MFLFVGRRRGCCCPLEGMRPVRPQTSPFLPGLTDSALFSARPAVPSASRCPQRLPLPPAPPAVLSASRCSQRLPLPPAPPAAPSASRCSQHLPLPPAPPAAPSASRCSQHLPLFPAPPAAQPCSTDSRVKHSLAIPSHWNQWTCPLE